MIDSDVCSSYVDLHQVVVLRFRFRKDADQVQKERGLSSLYVAIKGYNESFNPC